MKRTEAKVIGRMISSAEQTRQKRSYDGDGRKPTKTKYATGRLTNAAELDEETGRVEQLKTRPKGKKKNPGKRPANKNVKCTLSWKIS